MDLKKLLASSIRQRILEELSKSKQMRMMQLVHKVGSPYNEVNRNLGILEVEGIIVSDCSKPIRHGVTRVIRLNVENPRTKMLLDALKLLGKEKSNQP
jgi:predicted transcriptional regulator